MVWNTFYTLRICPALVRVFCDINIPKPIKTKGVAISGNERVGGLVGENRRNASITTSFWDIETSGLASSDGGTGKTTAEMQTAITFLEAGWDLVDETVNGTDDIWWILEGQDYPRLWWELIPEN